MAPPSTLYERFVKDAQVIVKALETDHNCLVDENLVFERLESLNKRHPDCQGENLLKRVITSFLIGFGLPSSESPDIQIVDIVPSESPDIQIVDIVPSESPDIQIVDIVPSESPDIQIVDIVPSESPDIQIVDIVEPKVPSEPSTSSVRSAVSTLTGSKGPVGSATSCSKEKSKIETWTSSPGLCQGFNKPLVPYPLSPEEDKEETASGSSHATIGSPLLKKMESFNLDPSEVFVSEKNLKSSPESPKKTYSPASRDEGPLLDASMEARINPKIHSIKSESKAAANAATLSEMFPQADPQYLRDKAEKISDDNELGTLIDFMLSTNDYPRVSRVPLLDQPLEITGVRERKKVERFEIKWESNGTKKNNLW